MYLASKEDALSPKVCDFFLSYYKKQKKKISKLFNGNDDNTYFFRMMDIPFYHLRMLLLWRSHLRKIKKDFPLLKYNYGQIMHWPHGSCKGLHKDRDYPPNKNVGSGIVDWVSVCYLNDDFSGGETIVGDTAFDPKKGKLVVFNSKRLDHGVERVYGNRYTLIAWWEDTNK